MSSRLGGPARSTDLGRCFTGIGLPGRAQIDLFGTSYSTGLPIITSMHIGGSVRVLCAVSDYVR